MSAPHMFFFCVKVWFKILKTLSFGFIQHPYKNGNYEELELIKIKPWVEVMEAFTDMTKHVETFGLVESVLWRHKI